MQTVFDIGMFDGLDTSYYLDLGYRVVAVEANPMLVGEAQQRFKHLLDSGQLVCIHAAIAERSEPIQLALVGADLGSSSVFHDRAVNRRPVGLIDVPGLAMNDLIGQYGVPRFIKVDIEGADRFAVLPLTSRTRPEFLSFEIGDDADDLVAHAAAVGYRRFKIVNQNTFREIANVNSLRDRATRKLLHLMGYGEPAMVRRAGRFFRTGHSSGPVPWQGDGRWRSLESVRAVLRNRELPGWNDLHACVS